MSIHSETENWRLHQGDCLDELDIPDYRGQVSLVAFDPPFGTGKQFAGPNGGYNDPESDPAVYLPWLRRVVELGYRLLHAEGQMLVQLDYRFVHEAKVHCLDPVFGRDSFIGELVVYSGLGATSRNKWTNKHSTILHYAKNPKRFYFDHDAILTETRSARKANLPADKKMCSVQDWTLSSSDIRRVGFPTQKHPDLYAQLVRVHCPKGAIVADPTAGSGTTGAAAILNDRNALLCELNPETCDLIANRLRGL